MEIIRPKTEENDKGQLIWLIKFLSFRSYAQK